MSSQGQNLLVLRKPCVEGDGPCAGGCLYSAMRMRVQGRSPQQGGLRAPSPTLGAPLEEVEVRFGMPLDRNSVTVQLLASPSRGGTPPPPGGLPGPGSAGTPGIGRALAGAARFVMEKLAEVRADVAKARLDLLKGALRSLSGEPILVLQCGTVNTGDRAGIEAFHVQLESPHVSSFASFHAAMTGPLQ